jgi:cell wall assembly regulator SMI1
MTDAPDLTGESHRTTQMSWRRLITDIYERRPRQPRIAAKPEFYPGASAASIAYAEATLNAALPESLRSLLLETNGVMDMMAIDNGDWFESMWLLWKIEEIGEQNRFYREAREEGTYERDFNCLVFFAGAGSDGILFAFPVEEGVCAPRIMVWHPIMDELDELAPSLEDFLRGWLTDTISF